MIQSILLIRRFILVIRLRLFNKSFFWRCLLLPILYCVSISYCSWCIWGMTTSTWITVIWLRARGSLFLEEFWQAWLFVNCLAWCFGVYFKINGFLLFFFLTHLIGCILLSSILYSNFNLIEMLSNSLLIFLNIISTSIYRYLFQIIVFLQCL